jgi:hypothetical protein
MLGTLLFTIVVTGVYGFTIERIAYKPCATPPAWHR